VNQLFWRHRKLFDRLIESGDRLRGTNAMTGDATRETASARREAVTELSALAAGLLREAGHGDTHTLLRRVTTTLDALSSYGSLPNAPRAGRLTDDLEPPGFEALLGSLPAAGRRAASAQPVQLRKPVADSAATHAGTAKDAAAAARRAEEERKRLSAEAKAAVRAAEREAKAASKQAERAATKREDAEARAKALDAERAQLEKQLARVAQDAAAAQRDARDAAAEEKRVTKAATDAERSLDLARNRLKQLEGPQARTRS
jgi:hypothetical protein